MPSDKFLKRIRRKRQVCVSMLLKKGVDSNIKNREGKTALTFFMFPVTIATNGISEKLPCLEIDSSSYH